MSSNVRRHCKARYGLNNNFFACEMFEAKCIKVAESVRDGTVIQGVTEASDAINSIHYFTMISIEFGHADLEAGSPG